MSREFPARSLFARRGLRMIAFVAAATLVQATAAPATAQPARAFANRGAAAPAPAPEAASAPSPSPASALASALAAAPAPAPAPEQASGPARPPVLADAEAWQAQAQQIGLGLVSAISGVAIHGSPALNLAQRLDTLPGVIVDRELGDARYVRIRGLDPRWTAVRLDGDRLPTSDPSARRAPLNLVPASLFEQAEVSRTASVDRDGDAIGGAVNLVTRLPQAAAHGQTAVSGGYHAQRSDAGELGGQATFGRRVSDGRVGLLGGFSAQSSPLSAGGVDVSYTGSAPFNRHPARLDVSSIVVDRQQQGAYGVVDVAHGEQSVVTMRGLFGRLAETSEARTQTYDAAGTVGSLARTLVDTTQRDLLGRGALAGQRVLLGRRALLDYRASYGYAWRQQPDSLMTAFGYGGVRYVPASTGAGIDPETLTAQPLDERLSSYRLLSSQSSTEANARERTLQAGAHVTLPLRESGTLRAVLKAGTKVGQLSHTRNDDVWSFQLPFGNTTLESVGAAPFDAGRFLDGRYSLGAFIDPARAREMARDPYLVPPAMNAVTDYRGDERTTAAFALTELAVGERLVLAPGLRYEHTRFDYRANGVTLDFDSQSVAPTRGASSTGEWLPMINARYALTSSLVLRAAFTRTLARPDYGDLAPSFIQPYGIATVFRGNPDLRNTMSWNTDVMLERTLAGGGTLFGGVFHKAIARPVFRFAIDDPDSAPGAPRRAMQPLNGGDARLTGMEAGYQQRLGFLPRALRGVSVWANYTFSGSTAAVPERTGDGASAIFPEIAGRDITLPGVPRHGAHAMVAYDRPHLSARLMASVRGSSLDQVGALVLNDLLQARRTQLDASIQQRLLGQTWLFVDLYNLTSAPMRFYENSVDRTVREQDYRWWSSFGLRMHF